MTYTQQFMFNGHWRNVVKEEDRIADEITVDGKTLTRICVEQSGQSKIATYVPAYCENQRHCIRPSAAGLMAEINALLSSCRKADVTPLAFEFKRHKDKGINIYMRAVKNGD